MQTQEPAGDRDQSAPAQGAEATSAVTLAQDAPPVSNESAVLWTTFGGAAAVFIVVFVFILRSRIAPGGLYRTTTPGKAARKKETAPKRAKKGGKQSDFFQPAGQGAEITFDEPPVTAKKSRGKADPVEPVAETSDGEAQVIIERAPDPDEPPLSATPLAAMDDLPARRASPFAGLFAKKKREEADHAAQREAAKEPVVEAPAPAPVEAPTRFNPFSSNRPAFAKPYVQRAEEPSEDAIAAAVEEERRRAFEEEEQARALEDERRRLAERKLAADREAEFERRKQAAFDQRQQEIEERERALAARTATMDSQEREIRRDLAFELDERFQALTDRFESRLRQPDVDPAASDNAVRAIASLSREIDDRFVALSERLEGRITAQSALRGSVAVGEASYFGGDEAVSKRLAEHRSAIDESIAALSSRIDDITGAPFDVKSLRAEIANLKRALSERASGPSAPVIQLSDIVRNALPPNAYEMRAMLPNNRKADCVIKLAHPPGPIAIDARFPVEAFHRLHEAPEGQERAENEFRRLTLRHIVDIAERLIVPDETAESALMFVPSESMYAELHARFPDIIQDSYRARVWIVSPTTLMATLHTIRAVLRDAHARESADLIQSEAQHVLGEVDGLRRRVGTLEENFNRARHDVRDLISTTDQVYRRAETITNTRRSLAEGAHDRAPRKYPAAQDDPDDVPPPPSAAPTKADPADTGDLWEDNHSETDDRTRFPLR